MKPNTNSQTGKFLVNIRTTNEASTSFSNDNQNIGNNKRSIGETSNGVSSTSSSREYEHLRNFDAIDRISNSSMSEERMSRDGLAAPTEYRKLISRMKKTFLLRLMTVLLVARAFPALMVSHLHDSLSIRCILSTSKTEQNNGYL